MGKNGGKMTYTIVKTRGQCAPCATSPLYLFLRHIKLAVKYATHLAACFTNWSQPTIKLQVRK